ncbi:hypothetical protein [Massilia sp. DD77]|uniref:hypothetical protein n=1 Tax=Massilia sp. DD77 TaxID=3109349 RepID=UPI002FFD9A17
MTEPQRRIDDQHPAQPLEWSDAGTPLPESSIVYLACARGATGDLWMEVKTQETLEALRGSPAHELRTVFTVPVDELARAPIAAVVAARTELDRLARQAAPELADLTRYSLIGSLMNPTPHGAYVRFDDARALLAKAAAGEAPPDGEPE